MTGINKRNWPPCTAQVISARNLPSRCILVDRCISSRLQAHVIAKYLI